MWPVGPDSFSQTILQIFYCQVILTFVAIMTKLDFVTFFFLQTLAFMVVHWELVVKALLNFLMACIIPTACHKNRFINDMTLSELQKCFRKNIFAKKKKKINIT